MTLTATKVETAALGLINSLRLWLQVFRVVNKSRESTCAVLFRHGLVMNAVVRSSLLLLQDLLLQMLLVYLLWQMNRILLFLFVEFYQLPLQSLSHLHLREGLLMPCSYLDALRVVDSLRESTRSVWRVLWPARHVKIIVIVEAVPTFSSFWICCLLFFWWGEAFNLLYTIIRNV